MCLILFAYNAHPWYRLVLAANRDEFYQRPTAPLGFWEDHPHILAGRDLEQLGTWMGINHHSGRFAAITNYRSPIANRHNTPSRGYLVAEFLIDRQPVRDYLQKIQSSGKEYSGFNLIIGDKKQVYYYSNQNDRPIRLQPGIYGLSNHLLNTPWPKVSQGKQALSNLLRKKRRIDTAQLIEILQNQQAPADDELPDTGIGQQWERILSPVFITSPDYGTRSSSALLIDKDDHVVFCERTWQPGQSIPVDGHTQCYEFRI